MSFGTRQRQNARRRLLQRDPHCWFCGRELCLRYSTIDHLVPRSRGGKGSDNLVLACQRCNSLKGDLLLSQIAVSVRRGVGVVLLGKDGQPLESEDSSMNGRIVGFNYAVLKGGKGPTAEDHARAIRRLVERNTHNSIEIGRRLLEVKRLTGKYFAAWLRAEFKWVHSVASNYMQIAERFGDLDCLDRFDHTALVRLVRKSTPPALVDQAIERARSGETMTHKQVAKMLAEANPKAPMPDAVYSLRKYVERLTVQLGPNFIAEQLAALAVELKAKAAEAAAEPRPRFLADKSAEAAGSSRRRELSVA